MRRSSALAAVSMPDPSTPQLGMRTGERAQHIELRPDGGIVWLPCRRAEAREAGLAAGPQLAPDLLNVGERGGVING